MCTAWEAEDRSRDAAAAVTSRRHIPCHKTIPWRTSFQPPICSYTEDRLAAFADGVTLHVRPDRQRWRPFAALSGGQQALATLALCFALQAAFPAPFFFMDEVDASLDTVRGWVGERWSLIELHSPCAACCFACLPPS